MKKNIKSTVLQVLPKIPFDLSNGGDIAIFGMTKALKKLNYNIDWIGFDHESTENDDVNKKKNMIRKLIKIRSNKMNSNLFDYIISLFQPYPYLIWKYKSDEYQSQLDSLLKQNKYDVVQFEHINSTLFAFDIKKKTDAKIILRAHSLNTNHYKNLFHLENNYFKKIVYFIEYRKYKYYEHKIFNLFDIVLYITEEEKNYFLDRKNNFKSFVIPLALDKKPKKYKSKDGRLNLLWSGDLPIMQHRRSIEIFIKEIFPSLYAIWPNLIFNVVGKSPNRNLLSLETESIKFFGFQKNIGDFYLNSDVFIAPLYAGNGLKVKIVNALLNGLPVITTPIGAEGFGKLKDNYMFICNSKIDFINSIKTVNNNKRKTDEMVTSGQQYIENTMNMNSIIKKLEKIY